MIKKSPILCVFLLLFVAQFLVAQVTPVANNDVKTTLINTSLTENTPGLLINDTDADGDSLTITEFLINGTTFTAGENASFSEGSIVISADGSFNFDPNLDFLGTVSEINYTVSDGTFTSNANLNITVTLPPEPPVANNDEKITQMQMEMSLQLPNF